jgi:UDP-glucose 4-epimerase
MISVYKNARASSSHIDQLPELSEGGPLNVVVTGGAGFIGSHLVRRLLEIPGYKVIVLDDMSTGVRSEYSCSSLEWVVGSILDAPLVDDIVSGADSVVHLAARPSVARSISDPVSTHDVNVGGTIRVLDACRRSNVRQFILASSSSVYGDSDAKSKSETDRISPRSPYAASKAAAEHYALAFARSYGIPTLAFRFFNVFGPSQREDLPHAAVIPRFIAQLEARKPIQVFGDGLQSRDFTYVGTVCDVIVDAIERTVACDNPVNLAFGGETSLLELVGLLEGIMELQSEIIYEPARAGDVRSSRADSSALRGLFPSVNPLAVDAALAITVEWFRGQRLGSHV